MRSAFSRNDSVLVVRPGSTDAAAALVFIVVGLAGVLWLLLGGRLLLFSRGEALVLLLVMAGMGAVTLQSRVEITRERVREHILWNKRIKIPENVTVVRDGPRIALIVSGTNRRIYRFPKLIRQSAELEEEIRSFLSA